MGKGRLTMEAEDFYRKVAVQESYLLSDVSHVQPLDIQAPLREAQQNGMPGKLAFLLDPPLPSPLL
jgi:hypothetical protein